METVSKMNRALHSLETVSSGGERKEEQKKKKKKNILVGDKERRKTVNLKLILL